MDVATDVDEIDPDPCGVIADEEMLEVVSVVDVALTEDAADDVDVSDESTAEVSEDVLDAVVVETGVKLAADELSTIVPAVAESVLEAASWLCVSTDIVRRSSRHCSTAHDRIVTGSEDAASTNEAIK